MTCDDETADGICESNTQRKSKLVVCSNKYSNHDNKYIVIDRR